MQCYRDTVFGRNTNGNLIPVVGAIVTVNTSPANTLATLFSNNAGSPLANPITTAADGSFLFYAANGRYSLSVNVQGSVTVYNDIVLEDDPASANNPVIITGGSIDGTPIGATTPSTGAFTNLSATGTLTGFPGRLLNVQIFGTSGTYTPTAGTNSVIVEAQGAGGGGGGCAATAASQSSVGSGGGSGAFARVRYTSGFSGVAITVASGGAGGAAGNNAGTTPGATSFGALVSCPGGIGGGGGAAQGSVAATTASGSTVGPSISGGTIMTAAPGSPATLGLVTVPGSSSMSGQGASSIFGSGGNGRGGAGAGIAGTGAGSGGSGGNQTTASSAAQAGGNGSGGTIIVYEFA